MEALALMGGTLSTFCSERKLLLQVRGLLLRSTGMEGGPWFSLSVVKGGAEYVCVVVERGGLVALMNLCGGTVTFLT